MQKGGPVAVLKRRLEEKEKQLATEQEAAAAARNKRRELSKVSAAQPSRHPWHGPCPSRHGGTSEGVTLFKAF